MVPVVVQLRPCKRSRGLSENGDWLPHVVPPAQCKCDMQGAYPPFRKDSHFLPWYLARPRNSRGCIVTPDMAMGYGIEFLAVAPGGGFDIIPAIPVLATVHDCRPPYAFPPEKDGHAHRISFEQFVTNVDDKTNSVGLLGVVRDCGHRVYGLRAIPACAAMVAPCRHERDDRQADLRRHAVLDG